MRNLGNKHKRIQAKKEKRIAKQREMERAKEAKRITKQLEIERVRAEKHVAKQEKIKRGKEAKRDIQQADVALTQSGEKGIQSLGGDWPSKSGITDVWMEGGVMYAGDDYDDPPHAGFLVNVVDGVVHGLAHDTCMFCDAGVPPDLHAKEPVKPKSEIVGHVKYEVVLDDIRECYGLEKREPGWANEIGRPYVL